MRKYALLLAGVCLLHTSALAAIASAAPVGQAAGATKPAPPKVVPPAQDAKPQERKEIKVTEKVLKTYVGDYEMGPDRILHITLENGSLWGQPGAQEKKQLFAETQTKFFLKDLDIQLTFQKDAKGNVTGLQLVQRGNPSEGKKIK